MFESKTFMYQKPDSVPKEKKVLVLFENEASVEGIDLNLLNEEQKAILGNAVVKIKSFVGSGVYRKYLKSRIVT